MHRCLSLVPRSPAASLFARPALASRLSSASTALSAALSLTVIGCGVSTGTQQRTASFLSKSGLKTNPAMAAAASAPIKEQHFDLVVIGGGSGGLAAAKEAAKAHPGKKVLCLDHVAPSARGTKWGLGGTCVNVGCIPKKLMHHAGNIGALLHKDAEEYGWKGAGSDDIKHDWPTMRMMTGDYIHSLNFAYGVGLRGAGVTYAEARAVFTGPNSLLHTTNAGKQTKVTFDRAIISTGGRPVRLPIPGAQLAITSDDLFWLKQSPGTTLVIGGGYIALECASFLHHLNSRAGHPVSVMVRGPVLRKMDQQCAEQVAELMERDGIRFLQAVPVGIRSTAEVVLPASSQPHPQFAGWFSLDPDAKGNARWVEKETGVVQIIHNKPAGLVTFAAFDEKAPLEVSWTRNEDGTTVSEKFDTVVFATGRISQLDELSLDKAGVAVHNPSGSPKILTDAADATTNPHIFAIGDVATGVPQHVTNGQAQSFIPIDRPELTPVAIQAGQLLAQRLWGPKEHVSGADVPASAANPNTNLSLMNYNLVASTVFASPSEYAFVGMSEEQARLSVAQGGIGAENVEVYWSRFGNLEISPLHPHLPAQRSTAFTDRALWHKRWVEARNLDWPEVTFPADGMNRNVWYQPSKGAQELSAVVEEMHREEGKPIRYTIKLDDGGAIVRDVLGSALRLHDSVRVENAELFYKANALCKLVVDKSRGEAVVGLHFVGPDAGEVVQGFALALSLGASKAHFDRLVGIHPTAAEEFSVLTVKQSEGKTLLKQAGCGGGSCG